MRQAETDTTTKPEAFIASLFAPLPEGEEPVMSRAFRSECSDAARKAWYAARRHYELIMCLTHLQNWGAVAAKADIARITRLSGIGADFWTTAKHHELGDSRCEARDRLIRTPAPTKADLLFKKVQAKRFKLRPMPAWDAAIAADEARLAGRATPKAGARS